MSATNLMIWTHGKSMTRVLKICKHFRHFPDEMRHQIAAQKMEHDSRNPRQTKQHEAPLTDTLIVTICGIRFSIFNEIGPQADIRA